MKFWWLIAAFSCQLVFAASSDIQQSLDATDATKLVVENSRGNLTLTGSDSEQVLVSGKVDSAAESLVFEQQGDAIVLKVIMPENKSFRGKSSSDLSITLPKRLALEVKTVSASVEVSGLSKAVNIETVSGSVKCQNLLGGAKINSVSGELKLLQTDGTLALSSVSGDIEVQSDATSVSISAISGDVQAKLSSIEQLKVTSVSGGITINGKVSEKPFVKLSSVTGEIALSLENPLNAKLDMQTGPGGDIINKLSDDTADASFISEKSLQLELGTSAGRVKMTTVSGALIIQ